MRCLCTLLLAVGIASGCNETKSVAVTSSADPDFDRALGAIEASTDWEAAHSEAATHRVGVVRAIDTLRGYLANDRVISREYSTHYSVMGTMGDLAFGAIRDAIETHLPNRYRAYSAFSRSNLEDWLDRHQGKTLVELQVEAASTSLERAREEYELDGNEDAQAAIAVFTELLQTRLLTQAIYDIVDSDIAYSGLAVMLTRTKNLNLKIYGTIASRDDLDRLNRRLKQEKYDIRRSLRWDVRLQDTGETIAGLDREVYTTEQEMTEQ